MHHFLLPSTLCSPFCFLFSNDPATTDIYTLSLHDALPIFGELGAPNELWVRLHYVYPYPHVDDVVGLMAEGKVLPYLDIPFQHRSEEHTSELQSRENLVCRLLLEKKNKTNIHQHC